jgi:hypothetical protein
VSTLDIADTSYTFKGYGIANGFFAAMQQTKSNVEMKLQFELFSTAALAVYKCKKL